VAEYVDTVWQEAHLRILAGREEPPRVHLLRFNSAQRRLNAVVREEFRKKRPIRLIICKARQEGVSTWVEALIYARCRLVPDQSGVILSHDPEGTANLYSMYQRYLDHDEAHPPTRFSSMKGLTFAPPHNSQVVVQTAAKRFAGTGQTHQMAHLSELAKWAFPEETMLSLMQAIPDIPESLVIIESTAYGAGGYFHEQWEAAVAGESGWRPVFLPWYIHAEYCLDLPARDLDEALEDFGTHDRYNFYPGEEDDLVARFALTRGQLAWRRRAIDIKCGGTCCSSGRNTRLLRRSLSLPVALLDLPCAPCRPGMTTPSSPASWGPCPWISVSERLTSGCLRERGTGSRYGGRSTLPTGTSCSRIVQGVIRGEITIQPR